MKKLYILMLSVSIYCGSFSQIVISQVYGGGGNASAPYNKDFVELFNRGNTTISLAGWSIQDANTATSTTWGVTNLSGSLAPGQYYLIQFSGGTTGVDLPTPDATTTRSLAATSGKIALVNNTTALTGTCPASSSYIDLVGYGTTPNCFEGAGPAPAGSNTTSVMRMGSGCTDTDNNSVDFSTSAPNPRNTSSTQNSCSVLPVSLKDFRASYDKSTNKISLSWTTVKEDDLKLFVIERSSNSIAWTEAGIVTATGNSNDLRHYEFIDVATRDGKTFYRLKMIDNDLSFKYSKIISVSTGKESKADIVLYPNPLKGNQLNIMSNDLPAGNYFIKIVGMSGQNIFMEQIKHPGGALNKNFVINTISPGLYAVVLSSEVIIQKQIVVE